MFALWSTLARIAGIVAMVAALGSGTATPALVTARTGAPPQGVVGRDVGGTSCATALGHDASFGIVATTAGRPYYASPCLASEYAWAGQLSYRPEYYVNLADPGHGSSHWNQGGPKACNPRPRYDVGCAYDYGYQAAAAAWGYVQSVGASGTGRWWLDVEIDNTWGYTKAGVAANIAVIRGALHALHSHPQVAAGIYTETVWWWEITNDTKAFAATAVWGGGAGSKREASANCLAHSITGGPALLAQWIANGVDHDISC